MAVDKRSARLGVLATVSLILIGLLGARLWFLQGVESEAYQAKVTASKTAVVYTPPERGRIFDAKGRVLADNKRILTVTVDWAVVKKLKNRKELFERLSGPLETPVDDLMRRYDPCYPEKPEVCKVAQLYDRLLPLPLKEDVDEDTVAFIKERSEDYPGVDIMVQYKRVYLYAPLASHVIGYMGAITKESLDTYLAQGYKRNERVGQFGVELSLERELHGRWGKRVYEIDASGSIVRELVDERIEPVAGFDVQLSIDLDYQQYAEQALETELRSRRDLPFEPLGDHAPRNPLDPLTKFTSRVFYKTLPDGTKEDYPEYVNHKAPAGSVVMLDNRTGQVIAMASYPTFDNRWMEAGITGTKYKELFPSTNPDGTKIDPDQSILVNRAVQGNYNLGSTIKPFVAWSAMHAGLIRPYDIYDDRGTYTLDPAYTAPETCQNNGGNYKCVFKNAVCGNGTPCRYGAVDVESALAVSSDSYFYRLGELFFWASKALPEGSPNLLKVNLERFGFGNKTGIQLPYEWAGRIPDDATKKALVDRKVLAEGEVGRLLVGDEVQVAIGQGLMAATPLQIAVAYSTLANDGFRQQATVVKAIYAPLTPDLSAGVADLARGEIVKSYDKPVILDQLEDEGTIKPIINGLTRVMTKGGGVDSDFYHRATGETLFGDFHVPLAGKTGTAQGAANLPWNDSSAFGAFGLGDEDHYTVFSYLEKSGYGAKAAGPVTKCMFVAISDPTVMAPVLISDTLDLSSPFPAPSNPLVNAGCLARIADGQKG